MNIIKHFGEYAILRVTYVHLCDGDVCAALLLAAIEDWTICKLKNNGDIEIMWLDVHVDSLVDSVCGAFGRDRVLASFEGLKKKGFVEQHDSPGWTFLFRLNIEKVQTALDDLYAKTGGAV
jgi:hypothetical protein